MAWPMKVARNAPAMPSTVVRMNPLGLFGPGDSNRAMIPATKPTTMTQRMPLMSLSFVQNARFRWLASDPARQFLFGRQSPFGRQMVDHAGQILAEAGQQVVAQQPGL